MLNPSMTPAGVDAGKSPLKQKLDVLTEDSSDTQLEGTGEASALERKDLWKSKKARLSARGLLATLPRRVSITEINFMENSSRAGGTYADVVVATLVQTGRKVAVKKLRFVIHDDITEEKFLRVFVNEVRLLDKLSHPHIVEFIGFTEDMENRIAWLIFPWEDNGNLREFLRSGTWEIPERVSLIIDVASGLEYMHTRQPPICHGDLKSLNILVNSSNRAMITDFGSARIIREVQEPEADPALRATASAGAAPPSQAERSEFNVTVSNISLTLTGPACSFRWAPPEYFDGKPLDLASDIWALGWIAWEAITDCHPFHEIEMEWDITMRIVEGQLPLIYDHQQLSQIHRLCSIMQSCWKPEPKKRPSATECWKTLRWLPNSIPARRSGEISQIRSAALLREIGENHRLQGRLEESLKTLEHGLEIARSTGDQILVGDLLDRLGANHRGRSKYVEAEECFNEALAIFTSIRYDLGQANALKGLGDVQKPCFKYAEAEASYVQALSIYTSIGSDLGRAKVLRGLGDLQRLCSRQNEAEASFTLALSIYTSIGHDVGRASSLNGLGHVQQSCSKYVEAEASYTHALSIYTSIGNDLGRASSLKWIGNVQQHCSKYVEADASYAQSLSIYKRIKDGLGQVNSSLSLAEIRFRQARYAEAKALISDAATISAQIQYEWGKRTSQRLLDMLP